MIELETSPELIDGKYSISRVLASHKYGMTNREIDELSKDRIPSTWGWDKEAAPMIAEKRPNIIVPDGLSPGVNTDSTLDLFRLTMQIPTGEAVYLNPGENFKLLGADFDYVRMINAFFQTDDLIEGWNKSIDTNLIKDFLAEEIGYVRNSSVEHYLTSSRLGKIAETGVLLGILPYLMYSKYKQRATGLSKEGLGKRALLSGIAAGAVGGVLQSRIDNQVLGSIFSAGALSPREYGFYNLLLNFPSLFQDANTITARNAMIAMKTKDWIDTQSRDNSALILMGSLHIIDFDNTLADDARASKLLEEYLPKYIRSMRDFGRRNGLTERPDAVSNIARHFCAYDVIETRQKPVGMDYMTKQQAQDLIVSKDSFFSPRIAKLFR